MRTSSSKARLSLPLNKFGFVEYPTIIKTLVDLYDTRDLQHIAKSIKQLVKDCPMKEGKFASSDWEALWTENHAKNARERMTRRHYFSITKLVDRMVTPSKFMDFVIRDSFLESIGRYKKAKDTVFQGAILPDPEDLAEICNREIAMNYSLVTDYIDSLKYQRRLTDEAEDNLMHVSDTPFELGAKRNMWMAGVEGIYRLHGINFDRDTLIRASDARAATDFTVNHMNRYIHNSVKRGLDLLHEGLSGLHKSGRVHLFYGPPGRGKTHEAIAMAGDKSTIWALSNTVAFNGARRTRDAGKSSEPMSFEKVRFLKMLGTLDEIDAVDVLVDETSQMGCGDIDILLTAIDFVNRTGGKLVLMGDINQIPSFLSRGSVLYSIITEFPEFTTELTVNHRVDESSRLIADKAVDFSNDGYVAHFRPFEHTQLSLDLFSVLDPETIFITGAVTQSAAINAYKLNRVIPGMCLPVDGTEPFDFARNNQACSDALVRYMQDNAIECMAIDTEQLDTIKIMTNERYLCRANGMYYVDVVSRVDQTKRGKLKLSTFFKYFTPAYALNVNKAQGLEWNNVIITLADLFPKQGPLKGNFLLRSSFEHFYVAATRARKSLMVFSGNLDTGLIHLTPLRKFNLFQERA